MTHVAAALPGDDLPGGADGAGAPTATGRGLDGGRIGGFGKPTETFRTICDAAAGTVVPCPARC